MRQVCLLSLFVAGMYLASAQNITSAGQLATTISEVQLSIVSQPIESISPADILGEKYKGTWISYYDNGNRCDSGFLQNGKPHGVWKSWYPNGQLRVKMECASVGTKTSCLPLKQVLQDDTLGAISKASGASWPRTSLMRDNPCRCFSQLPWGEFNYL